VICLLFLTGCKVELYSQLSEKQANAMLSALIHGGVRTTKASMGKGLFQIRVEESDLARSITILDAKGLPGDEFATMGDLYKKEGLISSPMEERVRYMFALSQSIAETLTNIDGVLVARVHVALPESDKYSGDFRPTSASVFIKHHHKYSQDRAIPEIKRIVESSIEGLSYERIAVFMSSSEIGKSMNADGHSRGYASLDGSSGIFSSRKLILIMYASTTFLLMCTIG
jgi:type III secretion protein J